MGVRQQFGMLMGSRAICGAMVGQSGVPVTIFLFMFVALGIVFWALWKFEPRSMLNAGVFGLLLGVAYLLLLESAYEEDGGGTLYGNLAIALFVGAPLLYLIGSALLIWNGRTMIRNEGLSLSHLLAPIIGGIPVLMLLALIALVIAAVVGGDAPFFIGGVLLALAGGIYGYLLWTTYFTIPYAAFYTWFPKKRKPGFIIVHGSGLINGNVTPLLASRLDKAIDVYNKGGRVATIIPSGGQGADESRAEADAMAEYLLERDIPADHLVSEDQSTTTLENMEFSKLIIDKRSDGPVNTVFVTSNYHVFRTALIARKVGLDAQGVGSRTARYYLPSAIIREFIAILVMYKWWHIVPMAGAMALLLIVIFSG